MQLILKAFGIGEFINEASVTDGLKVHGRIPHPYAAAKTEADAMKMARLAVSTS